MDLNKDDAGSGSGDKRKSKAESDSPNSTKKFCSDTKTDSHDLSSEVSTSSIQDFFASSSDLKVTSQHPNDSEKLSLLVQSGSYIENQSHNIGSTTVSLDDSQSEVSLNDINIDPFISASCEISQTATCTGIDSSVSVPISEDSSFSMTGCLDTEVSEGQISETEMIVPTSSIALAQEKPCSEISGNDSDITNKNLSSCLETQVVSSSDQICSIKQSEDSSSKVVEDKILTHDEIVSSEICTAKEMVQELHLTSTTSSEVMGVTLDENNSLSPKSNKHVKKTTEQAHCSEYVLQMHQNSECASQIQPNESLQLSASNEITASDSTVIEKNLSAIENKQYLRLSETKYSSDDIPYLSVINDKTHYEKQTLQKRVERSGNTNSENIKKAHSKENVPNVPSPENLPSALVLEKNLPNTSVEETLPISSPFDKNLPSVPVEEKLPNIHGLDNLLSIPSLKKNLTNVHSLEENLPSIHSLEENLSSQVHSLKSEPVSVTEKIETANKSLSFKESLKNITLPLTDNSKNQSDVNTDIPSEPELKSQVPKIDSSFVPIGRPTQDVGSPVPDAENELDKKSEISAMEVDSTNTPAEGSSLDTPCDSGETSPCISTPADSCQVSAAPSPVMKEDPNLASESLLYDESSMDTKDLGENCVDGKEREEIKPVKLSKKKKKKNAVENKKTKGKTTPVLVDEETRMSANGISDIGIDEDSQSSTGTSSKREVRRYRCEVIVPESTEIFTADKVNEYLWPLDGMGEHYFIQEHIAQYLGVMSFKRKYPDLRRRPIESQEKEYLKDLGLVSEMACDLGLTAVRSEDVLDVIFNDFPSKYEELQRVLRERKEKLLKEKGKVEYQMVNLDKSKMQEYSRKAALSASKWNVAFNRERNEERRYAFDLQSFTLHIPLSRSVKIPASSTKMGSYPVAVLPGQYTDYCKRYTSSELRGMPLQTVLSGPFTAEELAAELQVIESDDDSAVASFGTCPEIKEEPEVPPVVDPLSAEKQPRCKVCNGGRARNKDGKPEPLIICGTCRTASHPTCIDLTLAMIDKIESYSWQCMDCKTCAQCNDPDDEERMIFCDMCDRGYHIYCVGLRKVPNGRWHCKECAVCFTCESKNPAGNEHIKNAEWQHEFKKDKDNKQLKYACTLCVPCDKYWKRRQFCSVCMKVYRSIPEDGMVRCSGCPKYVHKDGCSVIHDNERFCNICFKSRNKTALNHSRIIAAAKKKMATGNVMWK